MSESMSSVEIEDVLSSIRRLVSEDLRPVSRQPHPVEAGSKLILTPALRVVGGDEKQPDNGPVLAPEDLATVDTGGTSAEPAPEPAPSIESVVAAVGAAVTGQSPEAEAEDLAEIEADWSHLGWPEADSAGLVLSALDQVDEAEVIVQVDEAEVIVAPIQQSPAAATAWDGDGGDLDPLQDSDPQAGVFVSSRDAGRGGADDATMAAMPEDAAETARDDQAEAEAVAEINAAQTPQPEPVAADGAAGSFETGGQAMPSADSFDDEDAVLDEDVLRDLVRDIIREELQGTLGERITRNVRKLVRSEINRVLASREFD
ncbi:MAG: hypothetical protein Q8P60_05740 [Pseudorhodobacter sp.]|nr:hypothetical protein [Pseudorhodobacter sp.]